MSKIKAMQLALLALVLILCSACSKSVQEQEHLSRVCVTTYAYKTVGDLMIKADVHQVEDNLTNPVIVWIHGGALITGGRESVPAWFRDWALAEGYDIISLDYRLGDIISLRVFGGHGAVIGGVGDFSRSREGFGD